jgi:hypothetical protein
MTKTVFCTFRQPGFHNWEGAPVQYAYLAARHRHVFHVRVEVEVKGSDRQVEFIHLRNVCSRAFFEIRTDTAYDAPDYGSRSCEMLAADLREALLEDGFEASSIEVSEDGENGAKVNFD